MADAIIGAARITRREMLYCPNEEAIALLIEERSGMRPDRLPEGITYTQDIDEDARFFTYTFFRMEP